MFAVSQSKVTQWRRCKLSFHFANIRNLKPKVHARPLYFGSTVHAMLEATANGKDGRTALAEVAVRDEKLFREEQETFGRIIEDISFIMRAYRRYWADAPLKFIPINGRNAEVPFEAQIDPAIVCKGTIDGLVEHKNMGWLLENKTHKEFPSEDHRWSNIQGAVYLTVARLLDWPRLQGVCWNYIRSKEPTRPKVTKENKLTKTIVDTLPEVVLDVLEEYKLNPDDFTDYIRAQEDNLGTWFQRVFQPVQKDVVARLWEEFLETAHEMADYYATHSNNAPPPRSIDLHCRWCSFEKLCRAELQGLDVDWVIEKEYTANDYEAKTQTAAA
jgi:PD-(D/E)XK nuclease superfamily